MYEFFFSFVFFLDIFEQMQLCGCLPVGNAAARDEQKQTNVKQSVKRYSLKRGM
jgi:hypothetical protein